MSDQPWSFGQARQMCRSASAAQEQAEKSMREAWRDYAERERAYRKALAEKILQLRADGMAVTAAGDVARGDSHVADLKFARDVAEGVREVQAQAAWRRVADRKDAQRFADWSQRRELAEFHGNAPEEPEPAEPVVFGARSAA